MTAITIQTGLEEILKQYVNARAHEAFEKHKLRDIFREIEKLLTHSEPVQRRPDVEVQTSIGQGNWAKIPWIALLNKQETETTRSDIYCIYLFRQDMSGVYLALNQGVTLIKKEKGKLQARKILQERAEDIRKKSYQNLENNGFSIQDTIDLKVTGGRGADYEASTVAHKLYETTTIPKDSILLKDLETILKAYDQYVQDAVAGARNITVDRNISVAPRDEEVGPDLLHGFWRDASAEVVGLRISKAFAGHFIASLLTKRFLILTGLAGSGKTKLAQAFTRWITPAADPSPYYTLVPVGADWTGNENIVGYPDGLNNTTYVTKPALELIRHALDHAQVPHFLILDEMNLSHVERYFADMLSAIESGEAIPLYDGNPRKAGDQEVPQRLVLPANLFIIGTVNVDETTYMFSPKVLDRANVIEFRMEATELKAFLSAPKAPQLDYLDGQGQRFGSSFVAAAADKSYEVPAAINAAYQEEMLQFFNLLREHNAEFGYRIGYEAARFLYFYQLLGGFADTDIAWFNAAMDAVIIQKLLPKLHGSRTRLEGLLWALAWACGAERITRDGKDFAAQLQAAGAAQDEATYGPEELWCELQKPGNQPRYPLSYEKIMRMWRKLVREQFVSFSEA